MSCDDKINKFSYVETYSPTNYEYIYYSVSASTITGVDGTYQVDFIGSEKTSPNFLKDFEIKGGNRMNGTQAWIITRISSEKNVLNIRCNEKRIATF